MEKITVIYGGKSFEHDISIRSYKSFAENINKKYQLSTIYVDKDGLWYENNKLMNNIVDFLKEQDVIFPLIHGNIGEDGKLQGLFETFDIKYVGSNTISSALAMDKAFCKIILDKYNIKQVPYVILNKKTKIKEITSKLNYPVIVKPANGGSSIGISIANNARELVKALSNAFKYDKKVVVEKFVKARELEVGVIENNGIICSSIGEIKSQGFYDFDSKYIKDTEVIVNADLKKETKLKIKEYAREIFKILECSGFARVDFLYDEINEELYFNEINTIPGFTDISMFPKLFINDGYSYSEIIDILIKNAKRRP
ncbi:d-alanine--D-alanine ligase [Firmicutes bacterium CAG:884]|nr:d-alanine--D-alanine ligase [Firmicutes bacterium CAG:884]